MSMLKRLVSRFPLGLQQELKRVKFRRDIRKGVFRTDEREFARLRDWVGAGDWVVDIGANVGHYTLELSSIVGPTGRVFAFEPIPHTFELLAANVALFENRNVTLMNAAASDAMRIVAMDLPMFDSGLPNFYMASITAKEIAPYQVAAFPVDALGIAGRISLVKIDAEGHELSVLKGMSRLIADSRPVLIVEGEDPAVEALLKGMGFAFEQFPGSPNRVYLRADYQLNHAQA
jgi:FkbM family methyltransferase